MRTALPDGDVSPDLATAPPVFVVGLGRSGTTLTARILDGHSRISLCGESHFLRLTRGGRGEHPLTTDAAEAILERLPMKWTGVGRDDVLRVFESTDRSMRALFDSMMRARMLGRGKVRYGEKTPSHFWYLDQLFAWYPDARVVYLIRDPRYVQASFERSRFAPRLGRLERWVAPRALYWSYGARELSRARRERPEQVFALSFERLAREPEASVRELCDFIGEPFEPEMLDVAKHNSSFSDLGEGSGVHSQVLTRPLSIGRPKQALIELLSGPEMMAWGYDPGIVPRWMIRIVQALGGYALLRWVHGMARRLRGRP